MIFDGKFQTHIVAMQLSYLPVQNWRVCVCFIVWIYAFAWCLVLFSTIQSIRGRLIVSSSHHLCSWMSSSPPNLVIWPHTLCMWHWCTSSTSSSHYHHRINRCRCRFSGLDISWIEHTLTLIKKYTRKTTPTPVVAIILFYAHLTWAIPFLCCKRSGRSIRFPSSRSVPRSCLHICKYIYGHVTNPRRVCFCVCCS